ncbi:MAG: hypothetical protein OEQ29_15875 [Alphaproteobacteria bacterium]|nr:hypothetical protein [Alphaproteobacteria bacterium]
MPGPGSIGAGNGAGAATWVPKPGLIATVIVMAPEKFYKLANTLRPELRNRPVAGLAYFNKKKCIVWVRSDLSPTDFRLTLAHELRHCQGGHFHKD